MWRGLQMVGTGQNSKHFVSMGHGVRTLKRGEKTVLYVTEARN